MAVDRTSYIGGYDAGCILGVNPYCPPRLVWEQKVKGAYKDIDNHHIDRGNAMEPLVEQWIRENLDPTINSQQNFERFDHEGKAGGNVSGTSNQIFLFDTSLGVPIGGHPDGLGDDCVYEIKCPQQHKLEEIERFGAPLYWIYQIQHYMMITGLPRGKIVVWNYDMWGKPLIVDVEPNAELHERMRQEYPSFWMYVELGIEPQGYSPEEIQGLQVVNDDKLDELLAEYSSAYRQKYDAEERQKYAKSLIMTYAAGRNTIITPRFVAQISEVDRGSYKYTRLIVKDRNE